MRFGPVVTLLVVGMFTPILFESQEAPVHPLAPVFVLKDVNNRAVSLTDYRGQVVVLHFWKSSCLLCEKEVSNLIALSSKYASQGLIVIGISTDDHLYTQSKVDFPFVRGDKKTTDQYGSPIAPATLLIGRDGRVYTKHSDYVPPVALEGEIRQLLAMKGTAELFSFRSAGKAEPISLPTEKELNAEIPGIDITKLSSEQIKALEVTLDAAPCPCGCGNTMLSCRRRHGECAMSREAAQRERQKLLSQSK